MSLHGPVTTRKMTPEEYEKYFGKPPEVIRDRNGMPRKKPLYKDMAKHARTKKGEGNGTKV